MTREVIQVLELRQTRCGLRFGVGACTAAIGGKVTTQCVNTYATCPVRDLYDPTAQIRWLFTRPGDPLPRQRSGSGNEIVTNAYPILKSLTFSTQTKMNPGGSRKTESPFGIFGTFSASLTDFKMKEDVADHYERGITGPFWPIFKARIGEAVPQLEAYIYRGYKGQALEDMQVMRYDVQSLDAKIGGCQIKGQDPTARTSGTKAQFPRASDLQLAADIDATTTTVIVVGDEDDLTATFGNVTGRYVIRIGSEMIEYTGYTTGTGNYTLTGVVRGVGNTAAASHSQDDLCQRVGWYQRIPLHLVCKDLMENHAGLGGDFIDDAAWGLEGGRYLPTLRTRETFVTSPTAVEDLVSELMRDGIFSTWWDAFAAKIPLLAVRPPSDPIIELTDRAHIVGDGVSLTSEPDDRITRVTIYYNQFDATKNLDEKTNYRNGRLRAIAELEDENYADGTVRELAIYSRWISTNAQALLVGASLLNRFGETPEYTTVKLDAKDRAIEVGDVVSINSYDLLDAYGQRVVKGWQVIARDEPEPGHSVSITLQSYDIKGKFAVIMPNDAPDYATATEEERAFGCWLADDATGLMPDGSDPYLIQ